MQIIRFATLALFLTLFSCGQKLVHRLENHDMIRVDSTVGVDAALMNYIKPYRDSIEGIMADVIGTSAKPLIAKKPESELSNFVADLVLEAGKQFLKEQNITDGDVFCLINIRGLRAPMPQGEITTRNIFEIMPFENQLVAVKMNAENLHLLFEHIAQSDGDGLSGASFTLKNEKAFDIRIGGEPINEKKNYWVITSDYLADGGDSYNVFKKSDTLLVSDKKVRELIIEHIKELTRQNRPVEPDRTPRITKISN